MKVDVEVKVFSVILDKELSNFGLIGTLTFDGKDVLGNLNM